MAQVFDEILAVARRLVALLSTSSELVAVVTLGVALLTIALLTGAGTGLGVWVEDLLYRLRPSRAHQGE